MCLRSWFWHFLCLFFTFSDSVNPRYVPFCLIDLISFVDTQFVIFLLICSSYFYHPHWSNVWYKRCIHESLREAKMGRSSPVSLQIREEIIKLFENSVPKRKVGRDWHILPLQYTIWNDSSNLEAFQCVKRKGRNDFWSLRQTFINSWCYHMGKGLLSCTMIQSYIHKCNLKPYCLMLTLSRGRVDLSGTDHHTVETYSGQISFPDILPTRWHIFQGNPSIFQKVWRPRIVAHFIMR